MLSRKHRFHGHGGVRRVYRTGKPFRSNLASLHVVKHDKLRVSKVAVVVSRKVDRSAVRRNRIRRRIYAVTEAQLPTFKEPAELVVTVYSAELAAMPADELVRNLDELFQKAKL